MEARYVEAGSMNLFRTQNRAPTHQPCTHPDTYLVGPGGSELFSTVGPKSGSVGPGGSQLFSAWDPNRVRWGAVGPGGSQPFSTWDPTPRLGFTMLIRVRGGPVTTISLPFSIVVQA